MRDKPKEFCGDVPWIRIEDFDGKYIADSRTDQRVDRETIRKMNLKVFPVDTVLCSCSCRMGTTAIVSQPLVSNQTFIGIVPHHGLSSEFLYYLMQSSAEHLQSTATGAIQQYLSREDFQQLRFFSPLENEQRAIAAYLDRETARIDALIEKKKQQIELLQEKHAALISRAVTKGLNPNAKMKDSGIEWLGEIPEHWEVIRFKYVLWLQRGHDLPTTDFRDGPYPVCGSNGCIGYHAQFTTKGPGVTVGRSGSVGEVNYIYTDYWAHNTALYIKEFRRSIPRYAFYLLKTLDVKYLSEGTAVGTLNRNYIHDVPIAIPDVTEQRTIADYLDHETARIDALIEKINKSIDLLRKYRTALISAAVLGKIDVREEVS